MDIQKRIVFTVELEFTFPSLVPEAAASCLYHAFFFRPLPLFRAARFVPEGSSLGFIPVPLRAARPYATHNWLDAVRRSEEHTSELQSHSDLVCRLLLEKKK